MPMTIPAKRNGTTPPPAVMAVTPSEIMEQVLAKGDLSNLTDAERNRYYTRVCESQGLNPLTRPLEYIVLEGKLTLYARKDCTDQLRKINGVSVEILSREFVDGLYIVHVRAKDKHGREDEDMGAVVMEYPMRHKTKEGWKDHPKGGKPLEGLDRANALLKCVTKAKRRVTLSISGMGFLDETEVQDIPVDEAQDATADTKPKRVVGRSANGRKTAYAAKKDGTNDVFNDIRRQVANAPECEVLAQISRSYTKELADLPTAYMLILSREFEDKWQDLGGDLDESPVRAPEWSEL
jgi:hypothetical protein